MIIVQIMELDLGESFTKKVSRTYFNEGIEKALQTLTTNGDCCAMLVSSPLDDLDLDLDFCDDHLSQHPDTRETGDSSVLVQCMPTHCYCNVYCAIDVQLNTKQCTTSKCSDITGESRI